MIEPYHTGGGCMSYRVTEPDAKGFYSLITEGDSQAIPENPETDTMLIGAYHEDETDPLKLVTVEGRAGLLEWYVENVGYSPDEDIQGETPILELMDFVASLMLLHLANDRANAMQS